jgi:hypothetical protein
MTSPTPEQGDPVDPISTDPPSEPTFAKIADLFPARVRRWGYAVAGAWSVLMGAMVVNGEPPVWAGWITIAITALGFGTAVSNVPKATGEVMNMRGPRGGLGI